MWTGLHSEIVWRRNVCRGKILVTFLPQWSGACTKAEAPTWCVELVHMQQAELIAELIAQTVVDDYQSPVKPRHYIELRLGRAREYYQTQIPRCYRWLCFWEVVVTLATVSSAVLAYVDDVRSFAAVAAAVGAAVTS